MHMTIDRDVGVFVRFCRFAVCRASSQRGRGAHACIEGLESMRARGGGLAEERTDVMDPNAKTRVHGVSAEFVDSAPARSVCAARRLARCTCVSASARQSRAQCRARELCCTILM